MYRDRENLQGHLGIKDVRENIARRAMTNMPHTRLFDILEYMDHKNHHKVNGVAATALLPCLILYVYDHESNIFEVIYHLFFLMISFFPLLGNIMAHLQGWSKT
ncbi:hypothetical protein ACJX0J_015197 [Zea mays]